jgi:hypothetical protein
MTTAVEWLIDEHFGGIENCTPDFRVHIQQAKEMEKQQIINAYYVNCDVNTIQTGEQYYNETFKSDEQE